MLACVRARFRSGLRVLLRVRARMMLSVRMLLGARERESVGNEDVDEVRVGRVREEDTVL